jgi:hypothetical protein
MRWLAFLALLLPVAAAGGEAGDIARAVRESSFDRDECYRVRDLALIREDIRIYLADGHMIFSRPVAGRRIAAVFVADTDSGDAEALLLPPDRAERRSLAGFIGSPNLDEHFQTALFLFTSDMYATLKGQMAGNPANRKSPEMGLLLDQQWTPALRNLGSSYQTRITLDLLDGPARRGGLFAAALHNPRLGAFEILYDPEAPEEILAGRLTTRGEQVYFDVWTNFPARSARNNPTPPRRDATVGDYRIEATIDPGLFMTAVTRVKVKPSVDRLAAAAFEIAPQMQVSEVTVDGRPAEVLQPEALRDAALRGGNEMALVVPSEPLRQGREYEFEFHHSGKVILDAGDRVFYVSARGNWYPAQGLQFSNYDLLFRYPRDLDLVTPGDVVDDRTEGQQRITRRRTSAPIRMAAFNLGDYDHVRATRGGFQVDVCANRTLETALQPKIPPPSLSTPPRAQSRRSLPLEQAPPAPVSPQTRLRQLAAEVASAMEFMASRFGPPALPRVTVSPIPGTFGQGFPGLIYLSTLSYLKDLPAAHPGAQQQELFFEDVLQAHEMAHQWWGNRVIAAGYRDQWLMEALANYSALLYLEKSKGPHEVEAILDSYRRALLEKNENGQTVDSTGPIVLGARLENSVEPRAWRDITYGKGSWIIHMLRTRMGDQRFFAMLAALVSRYDRQEISTEQFRELAAGFLPPQTDDPKLEAFFDQWVYGTGIPSLKLTWALKGAAPALKLVGTLTQSGVAEDFAALAPVEIQLARDRTATEWVRAGAEPVTFTVALKQAPLKVALDPHNATLRK